MGVYVKNLTIRYGNNRNTITNTVKSSSGLKKKHIALSYRLCRKTISGGIVDMQKINTKYNYADHFDKASISTEVHNHINELTAD